MTDPHLLRLTPALNRLTGVLNRLTCRIRLGFRHSVSWDFVEISSLNPAGSRGKEERAEMRGLPCFADPANLVDRPQVMVSSNDLNICEATCITCTFMAKS